MREFSDMNDTRKTTADIEKLAADSKRTIQDFYNFFWDYMLDDREVVDLKKEWKAAVRA